MLQQYRPTQLLSRNPVMLSIKGCHTTVQNNLNSFSGHTFGITSPIPKPRHLTTRTRTMRLRKRAKSSYNDPSHNSESSSTQTDSQSTLGRIDSKERLKTEVEVLKKRSHRPFFATGRFLFPLGIVLGTLLGFAFVEPQDLQDLQAQVVTLVNQYDINLPEFPGFDMSRVEAEWTRLRTSIPEVWKFNNDGREFQVGEAMKARGLSAEYPLVLIPGIVSTGLESWSTAPAYRPFFREKLWGGFNMLSQVTFNKEKWIAAMMLDPVTGLDPPDAKIRAAEGIDAASSLIQGYWIWSKIVENLAVINYDTNNLFLAPYDWRLSYYNLEERDGYFSKLKTTIESLRQRQRKKVVVAAHSMGCSVFLVWTLMLILSKWVESPLHGNGGSDWVEKHIESHIAIAPTHLGVAKAMAAFLSGEMKDTVQMHPAGAYVLERFFSRKERQALFRSWAGSASMWMKGGNDVWGNDTHAPDDECDATHSHGQLIAFRANAVESNDKSINMTAVDASTWILEHTPATFQKMLESNYSYGIEKDEAQLARNNLDHTKWSNPLEISLPYAPSMKIYCVYGHGKDTERSYWYARGQYEQDEAFPDAANAQCEEANINECEHNHPPLDMPLSRTSWIDAAYTNETAFPKVRNGVKMGEGDGTVSLISLGAMCVEGWKRKRWNPAGIKITTVELPHRPVPTIPRGGANTSDHVDVLGSTGLNEIILKVAAGVGAEIQDTFVSNIREYSQKIQWD
ncbi:Phospholipid:diacylglycerol acyltransferase [Psilocybe cubensis]|uniref:Phospholipid:diacylglycerol acyltransferase n=2 Tax=Psilocybe cubensis TaxID=181762 RepID=A0ACB8HB49_PSICU|nr:Phospholipid:diacylglycerol acyltransferase [Psilocybe cubensis]KAH9485153.1 Phospholipid:diacylglycerol acyltransferase [Psilocybe cubensis]